MKKSYKVLILVILTCFSLFIFSNNVEATYTYINNNEYDKVENTVNDFIFYLDTGSSNIYNIIDGTNTELYQGIIEYLYEDIEIEYDVTKIEKISEDVYKVKGKIDASGENWNATGFSVFFEVQEYYGTYKIVYTDLFNKIGAENIIKTVLSIVGIVFLAIGLFFLIAIGIIVMIVVVVLVVTKKK